MLKKGIKLLLIILWAGVIFFFSMDTGVDSTEKSTSTILSITEIILHRNLTEKEKEIYVEKYELPIRKTAHFAIYFLLGFLIIWFIKEFHTPTKKDVLLTILIVFLYACSDEIHQLFVFERSGQFLDVLIDTLGGSTSTFLYYKLKKNTK